MRKSPRPGLGKMWGGSTAMGLDGKGLDLIHLDGEGV
jgi:hypothetical protein